MDTQAFQHLLSLFPQLTMRQRRLRNMNSLPLTQITSLAAQLPACRMLPHCPGRGYAVGPGVGRGLRRYRATKQVAHQFRSPRRLWLDSSSPKAQMLGRLRPGLIDSHGDRPTGCRPCGVCKKHRLLVASPLPGAMAAKVTRRHGKVSSRLMRPSSDAV